MSDRGTIIIEYDTVNSSQVYVSLSNCHWGSFIYPEIFRYLSFRFTDDSNKYTDSNLCTDVNYFILDFIEELNNSEGLFISDKLDETLCTNADSVIIVNFQKQIIYNENKAKWVSFRTVINELKSGENLERYLT